MKRKYDLVFGLGSVCSCTQSLRQAGLQLLSFPYDWIAPHVEANLRRDMCIRAETICSAFDGWFEERDFAFHGAHTNGKDKYYNEKLDLIFIHDFPIGVPLSQSFPGIRARYRRRIDRLLELLGRSKTILVVRMDRHDLPYRTSADDCTYVRNILSSRYPGTVFDVLLIQPDPSVPVGERKVEQLAEGVVRLLLDYRSGAAPTDDGNAPDVDRVITPQPPDISRIARALQEMYEVREYRTPDEIAANRRRQRRKRWAKVGARTWLEYRWKRIAIPVAGAFTRILGSAIGRLRRKRSV